MFVSMPYKFHQILTDLKKTKVITLILSLALLLITHPLLADPLIVANTSSQQQNLSLRELRNLFTMKKRFWANESEVTVFVLPNDHPTHDRFCKKLLNIFPHQLQSIWYRKIYTGTGQGPNQIDDAPSLLAAIAETPGAIGYIDSSALEEYEKNHDKNNIHIITIN